MARYHKVFWEHDFPSELVILYNEVADFGIDTRKVEVFRHGGMQYADRLQSSGDTSLSETPLASVEEVEDHRKFLLTQIDEQEFEPIWKRATGSGPENE